MMRLDFIVQAHKVVVKQRQVELVGALEPHIVHVGHEHLTSELLLGLRHLEQLQQRVESSQELGQRRPVQNLRGEAVLALERVHEDRLEVVEQVLRVRVHVRDEIVEGLLELGVGRAQLVDQSGSSHIGKDFHDRSRKPALTLNDSK